jgi:hypothetical protein
MSLLILIDPTRWMIRDYEYSIAIQVSFVPSIANPLPKFELLISLIEKSYHIELTIYSNSKFTSITTSYNL